MSVFDKLVLPAGLRPENDEKPLWGKIKLELFDERTGKLQERVEANNYVTDMLVNNVRWSARRMLASRVATTSPANQSSGSQWAPTDATNFYGVNSVQNTDYGPGLSQNYNVVYSGMGGVLLTDDTHPENASVDRYLRGRVIAWSDVLLYTGADTMRGQQNNSESNCTPTKAVFVFDWPTSSGNGTIGSVYWVGPQYSGSGVGHNQTWGYGTPLAIPAFGGASATQPWGREWSETFSGMTSEINRGFILDADGVSYWELTRAAQLVKRTLGTGAIVSGPFTIAGFSTGNAGPIGLTFDGTKFWSADGSNFKRFSTGGTVDLTYNFSGRSVASPYFLCFANGYLWFYDQSAGPAAYKQMDPATGNIVTSFNFSTVGLPSWNNTFSTPTFTIYVPNDGYNSDEFWFGYSGAIQIYTTAGVWKRTCYAYGHLGSSASPAAMDSSQQRYSVYCTGSGSVLIEQMNSYRDFHARSLLPSPVTKSNTQTMKLTYEFDYS